MIKIVLMLLTSLLMFVVTPAQAQSTVPTTSSTMVTEVLIRRPVADVFQYATTARNWWKWHPNTLATSGADGHSAEVGEELVEWVKFFGIPGGRFFWTVTDHQEDQRWQLEGEAEGGAIRFLLTYTLTPTGAGNTLFRRELVITMDANELVDLMREVVMSPYLSISSNIAVNNLKNKLEGPKWAW